MKKKSKEIKKVKGKEIDIIAWSMSNYALNTHFVITL